MTNHIMQNQIRILLLGAGTQGLAMAKDLYKCGCLVYMMSERYNYADCSRYVATVIHCEKAPSSNEYFQTIMSIIRRYSIDTIIPTGDANACFLSKNKNVLLEHVSFVMPDYHDYLIGTDKEQLMLLCEAKGYPHPYTINSVEDVSSIEKTRLKFPLLIKPNITCGGRGMTLVHNYEELIEKYPKIHAEYGDCHLQQYVKQGGAQVEVQLYIDENKNLLSSSVIYKYRWYPVDGGSSCCAVSVKNDRIVDILHHLLIDLNWVGFADFDTIEDPDTGELLILELNPRVPACVKTAIEAGVNWGEIIANAYLGKPQLKYEYREGEYLRHLGFEVLWFIKSPNRFRTYPNWFAFLGKHIHYQDMSDWTDPMPFICGTLRNIMKLLTNHAKDKVIR